MKIIESRFLLEQFRIPKSKKRRIRRKWAMRPENFRPNIRSGYIFEGAFVCHPKMAEILRKEFGL